MNAKTIEQELLPRLERAVSGLKRVEEKIEHILYTYLESHPEYFEKNDFRTGAFSRILSTLVASRFSCSQVLSYLSSDSWSEDFQQKFVPKPWRESGSLSHFTEVVLSIRFYLLQNTYSQFEGTNRIIARTLDKNGKKPAEIVHKVTGKYDQEFLQFLDEVRNTLHNNGYHYPRPGKKAIKNLSYSLNGREIEITEKEPVIIELDDIVTIVEKLVEMMEEAFQHSTIAKLPITKDISY